MLRIAELSLGPIESLALRLPNLGSASQATDPTHALSHNVPKTLEQILNVCTGLLCHRYIQSLSVSYAILREGLSQECTARDCRSSCNRQDLFNRAPVNSLASCSPSASGFVLRILRTWLLEGLVEGLGPMPLPTVADYHQHGTACKLRSVAKGASLRGSDGFGFEGFWGAFGCGSRQQPSVPADLQRP